MNVNRICPVCNGWLICTSSKVSDDGQWRTRYFTCSCCRLPGGPKLVVSTTDRHRMNNPLIRKRVLATCATS